MSALSFAFTKIVVADLEASERFYEKALGLSRVAYIEFGEGYDQLQEVVLAVPGSATGGANLQLIHYPARPKPAPSEAVIGFTVADAEKSVAAMTAAGGRVTVPVTAIADHNVTCAYVADLDGHLIEIIQFSVVANV